jgi:glutamine amidotransferase
MGQPMIAIIDSGGANITSVISAFDRMDVKTVFTSDIDTIKSADKIILPGVGAAKDAMAKLKNAELVPVIRALTQPVLGICLGMQLLFSASEEGNVDTLGIIAGQVKHFPRASNLPVPHMGWNKVRSTKDDPLLHGLDDEYFYFVHSYFAPVTDATIGTCKYGEDFTAVVHQDNFMGCQFHPERSGKAGQKILRNFLDLKPC